MQLVAWTVKHPGPRMCVRTIGGSSIFGDVELWQRLEILVTELSSRARRL